MNYCSFIVKILKKPELSFFENNITLSEIPVQFFSVPNFNSEKILNLTFWGNLAKDIVQYYQINDYVIIEGYISYKTIDTNIEMTMNDKEIEISVFKIYPYLLNIKQENK